MHKLYINYGKYDFIQDIPQLVYSTIFSQLLEVFICFLTLTDKYFYHLKDNTNKKKLITFLKIFHNINYKLVFFYIFTFIVFIVYYYIIYTFCAVYKNTQLHLIKDTVISFGTSMITPFGIYILPGIFRICALKAKKKDKECMFKFSKLLQWF